MKYLLTAAVLAFAAPAHAETAQETRDFCEMIGGLAQEVMDARQRGIELSQIIGAFGADSEYPDELRLVIREMALVAYQTPMLLNPVAGVAAVADFRTKYEIACYMSGADM
jgi:hypothetical protein